MNVDFEQAVEDWKAHDQWEFADKEASWGFFFMAGRESKQREKERKMQVTEFTDEDAADVGRALIKAIEAHAYPGWGPAECPSEIVGDLRNECDELRRDAERYRKLRDENAWGEDTSEGGGSRWNDLGEKHGAEFDAVVDALPSNAVGKADVR